MKGIKKLLGSLPLLNNTIELINNEINNVINNNIIVRNKIKIIKKGLKILIPVVKANAYPIVIKAIKPKKIVINNPRKFSFNLSDFWTFGGIVPMYKSDVSRDTNTVEISPINEFNEGRINKIIGIA